MPAASRREANVCRSSYRLNATPAFCWAAVQTLRQEFRIAHNSPRGTAHKNPGASETITS
jgi:hypothetical protein